jgi:mono/diheme cytochrome c family protein
MKSLFAATLVISILLVARAQLSPAIGTENVLLAAMSEPGMHHDRDGDEWNVTKAEDERPDPVPANRASLDRGKKIFEAKCAPCHGKTGKGDGPAAVAITPKLSDLRHSAGDHSAGNLAWKIAVGRAPMPAWKGTLSEAQIWDVVNYIKSLPAEHHHHEGNKEGHH